MESKEKSSMSSSEATRWGAKTHGPRWRLLLLEGHWRRVPGQEVRDRRGRSAPPSSHGAHRRPRTTSETPGPLTEPPERAARFSSGRWKTLLEKWFSSAHFLRRSVVLPFAPRPKQETPRSIGPIPASYFRYCSARRPAALFNNDSKDRRRWWRSLPRRQASTGKS